MTFKFIEDPGNDRVLRANLALSNQVSQAIRRGAYISGKSMVADLRADMSKTKGGKTYKVYKGRGGNALKRPRRHKASSANETPGVITGEFRKSVDFLVKGNRTLEFGSGNEGLAKDYAKILELGSSKMAARKPLGRTVHKFRSQVNSNITKEIKTKAKSLGFTITGGN